MIVRASTWQLADSMRDDSKPATLPDIDLIALKHDAAIPADYAQYLRTFDDSGYDDARR